MNKFMGWGIAIGVGIGAAVGAATDNMGQWVGIGVAIGIVIGSVMNAVKRKANLVTADGRRARDPSVAARGRGILRAATESGPSG